MNLARLSILAAAAALSGCMMVPVQPVAPGAYVYPPLQPGTSTVVVPVHPPVFVAPAPAVVPVVPRMQCIRWHLGQCVQVLITP